MTVSLSVSLAEQGIATDAVIKANLGTAALVEEAIRNGEGRMAAHGPLVVETGKHTGRSAKDKFIVRDTETENTVWWGKVNVPMTPEHFAALKEDFQRLPMGGGPAVIIGDARDGFTYSSDTNPEKLDARGLQALLAMAYA